MAATPGTTVTFTDKNNVTWAATVINTFTNDESEDMVTLSPFGKEDVIIMKESELD
jgi:hypothetical protein